MRSLGLTLLSLAFLACAFSRLPEFPDPNKAASSDIEPDLGIPPPISVKPTHVAVIASSDSDPAFYLRYHDVIFEVAVNQQNVVTYVATDGSSFSTPEGIRVGTTFAQAAAAAGTGVSIEPGLCCYVTLPSGWKAAAHQGRTSSDCGDTVKWLFKR